MKPLVIFSLLFGVSVLILVIYFIRGDFFVAVRDNGSEQGEFTDLAGLEVGGQDTTNRTQDSFATMSGESIPTQGLLENKAREVITPEFSAITNNRSLYEVFYDEPSGMVTITLYGSDAKKAREGVEDYLLSEFPYTKEQWCDINPTVMTNEFEDPRWSGINLGLTFCPLHVTL